MACFALSTAHAAPEAKSRTPAAKRSATPARRLRAAVTQPLHALIDFASPQAGIAPLRAAFGAPLRVLVAHAPADVRAVLDAA